MLVRLAASIAHAQAVPLAPAAGALGGTISETTVNVGAAAGGFLALAVVGAVGAVVGNEDKATSSSSSSTN